MKFTFDKDWIEKQAESEDDFEVGAGFSRIEPASAEDRLPPGKDLGTTVPAQSSHTRTPPSKA